MPTFVPVDMLLFLKLLGGLVEVAVFDGLNIDVGEATADVAEGFAAADSEPVVADPNSCKTWVSVDCHRIWIISAKMVFRDTVAARILVTAASAGNGAFCSVEVEKTFVRSVVKRLAQKCLTWSKVVLEYSKPLVVEF